MPESNLPKYKNGEEMRRKMSVPAKQTECLNCFTKIPIDPVTLSLEYPEHMAICGFRAVIAQLCPNCNQQLIAVMETVSKGNERIFREAWDQALDQMDLVPLENQL